VAGRSETNTARLRTTQANQPFSRSRPARSRSGGQRRAYKKAAVTKTLQEFIPRRQQKRLLELMGKLEWDKGFDHKAERSRR
jgi:hypothetical protein